MTTEWIQQFNENNQDHDRCCQLALKQPLPDEQLVLMSDASFTAVASAILTEDDPNQKHTLSQSPTRQSPMDRKRLLLQ